MPKSLALVILPVPRIYLWTAAVILHCKIQGVPKHRQRLVCCAGRQTDHCSRKNPCPETHGLVAVEMGSSNFSDRGPVHIFLINLRAAVSADYRIIVNMLNIIIETWHISLLNIFNFLKCNFTTLRI